MGNTPLPQTEPQDPIVTQDPLRALATQATQEIIDSQREVETEFRRLSTLATAEITRGFRATQIEDPTAFQYVAGAAGEVGTKILDGVMWVGQGAVNLVAGTDFNADSVDLAMGIRHLLGAGGDADLVRKQRASLFENFEAANPGYLAGIISPKSLRMTSGFAADAVTLLHPALLSGRIIRGGTAVGTAMGNALSRVGFSMMKRPGVLRKLGMTASQVDDLAKSGQFFTAVAQRSEGFQKFAASMGSWAKKAGISLPGLTGMATGFGGERFLSAQSEQDPTTGKFLAPTLEERFAVSLHAAAMSPLYLMLGNAAGRIQALLARPGLSKADRASLKAAQQWLKSPDIKAGAGLPQPIAKFLASNVDAVGLNAMSPEFWQTIKAGIHGDPEAWARAAAMHFGTAFGLAPLKANIPIDQARNWRSIAPEINNLETAAEAMGILRGEEMPVFHVELVDVTRPLFRAGMTLSEGLDVGLVKMRVQGMGEGGVIDVSSRGGPSGAELEIRLNPKLWSMVRGRPARQDVFQQVLQGDAARDFLHLLSQRMLSTRALATAQFSKEGFVEVEGGSGVWLEPEGQFFITVDPAGRRKVFDITEPQKGWRDDGQLELVEFSGGASPQDIEAIEGWSDFLSHYHRLGADAADLEPIRATMVAAYLGDPANPKVSAAKELLGRFDPKTASQLMTPDSLKVIAREFASVAAGSQSPDGAMRAILEASQGELVAAEVATQEAIKADAAVEPDAAQIGKDAVRAQEAREEVTEEGRPAPEEEARRVIAQRVEASTRTTLEEIAGERDWAEASPTARHAAAREYVEEAVGGGVEVRARQVAELFSISDKTARRRIREANEEIESLDPGEESRLSEAGFVRVPGVGGVAAALKRFGVSVARSKPFSGFQESQLSRVGRQAGETGKALEQKGRRIEDRVKENIARFIEQERLPAKDRTALRTLKSAARNSKSVKELARPVAIPGTRLSEAVAQQATEGRFEGTLSKAAAQLIKGIDAIRRATGVAAEEAGMQMAVTEHPEGPTKEGPPLKGKKKHVRVRPARTGRWLRSLADDGREMIEQGGAEFNDFVDQVAALPENGNLTKAMIRNGLKTLAGREAQTGEFEVNPLSGSEAFEFQRVIPRLPTHFETQGGKVIEVLESSPFSQAAGMIEGASRRVAFHEEFRGSKGAEKAREAQGLVPFGPQPVRLSPSDTLKEFVAAGGEPREGLELMRSLAGLPIDKPGVVTGFKGVDRAFRNIERFRRTFLLTKAWLLNLAEPFGTGGVYAGFGTFLKSAMRLGLSPKQTFQHYVAMGAINRSIIDRSFFQGRRILGAAETVRTTVGGPMRLTNKGVDLLNATTAGSFTERMAAGKANAADEAAIRALGFTDVESNSMMAGTGGTLYKTFARRFVTAMSGGTASKAESSAFANSRTFNQWVPFQRYFMFRTQQLVRLTGQLTSDIKTVWDTKPGTDARRIANRRAVGSARLYGRFFVGAAVAGTLSRYIMNAVADGPSDALRDMALDWAEDPLGFGLKSVGFGLIGGALATTGTVFASVLDPTVDFPEALARSTAPTSVAWEMAQFIPAAIDALPYVNSTGIGKYKDLGPIDGLGKLFSSWTPIVRDLDGIWAMAGMHEEPEFDSALRRLFKVLRDEGVQFSSGTIATDEEDIAFRKGIRRARDMIQNGWEPLGPEVLGELEEAMQVKGAVRVAGSLESQRVLSRLNKIEDPEVRAKVRGLLGEENFRILDAHDKVLEHAARRLRVKGGLTVIDSEDATGMIQNAINEGTLGRFETWKLPVEHVVDRTAEKVAQTQDFAGAFGADFDRLVDAMSMHRDQLQEVLGKELWDAVMEMNINEVPALMRGWLQQRVGNRAKSRIRTRAKETFLIDKEDKGR